MEIPSYFGTLLSVLMLSSFVKILTTLNILRFGVGLKDSPFGFVIIALSLVLTFFVMQSNTGHVEEALLKGEGAKINVEETFGPFLEKHAHPELVERFSLLAQKLGKTAPVTPEQAVPSASKIKEKFPVLMTAFMVSELKEAFELGFLFILPFLVVDLLVANVLMSLGITQISVAIVSLPLKILLFFAVDGWTLVVDKLVRGYIL